MGEEKALTSKLSILDSQCNEEAGAASEHSLSTFCQTFPRMKECHVLVAAAGGAGVGREEIFFGREEIFFGIEEIFFRREEIFFGPSHSQKVAEVKVLSDKEETTSLFWENAGWEL